MSTTWCATSGIGHRRPWRRAYSALLSVSDRTAAPEARIAMRVGGIELHVPDGIDAVLQSEHADDVNEFIATSPDSTVYHSSPYLEFSRAQNGAADILLLSKGGRQLVGVPLHPLSRSSFRSGYAGVL